MTFRVHDNIDTVRAVAFDYDDQYLSPGELAVQYREMEDAPTDDDYPHYAMSVWDAVRGEWVEV